MAHFLYNFEMRRRFQESLERCGKGGRRGLFEERPIRVLRLAASVNDGGVAKVMAQTVLRLDPREVATEILLFGPEEPLSPVLTGCPGVRIVQMPMQLWLGSWDRRVFGNVERLVRIFREARPDIVHLHGPACAPAVWMAARKAGIPLVVQLHSAYLTRRENIDPLHLKMEKDVLRRCPLIAHAAGVAEDARRYLGGEAGDLPEIYLTEDGIDDRALWSENRRLGEWVEEQAQGRPVVFLSARLVSLKRIGDFIEACRRLVNEGVELFPVAAVYGGEKKEVRAEVKGAFREAFGPGEGEILRNLGTPADLISRARVAVSCSEVEGLPKSILEYMRLGVPVVCSDIAGHRELVRHAATGLLFPVGDVGGLVRELRRVLMDEDLRSSLVAAARESISGRRWENTARQVTGIYRGMVGGGGK
ncbi:glycosyltransferase family 4 protein [bacterium]|nr:glycosyltransferase family 4 protein [bacterium]